MYARDVTNAYHSTKLVRMLLTLHNAYEKRVIA